MDSSHPAPTPFITAPAPSLMDARVAMQQTGKVLLGCHQRQCGGVDPPRPGLARPAPLPQHAYRSNRRAEGDTRPPERRDPDSADNSPPGTGRGRGPLLPSYCQPVNLTVKLWPQRKTLATGTTIRGLLTRTVLMCLHY